MRFDRRGEGSGESQRAATVRGVGICRSTHLGVGAELMGVCNLSGFPRFPESMDVRNRSSPPHADRTTQPGLVIFVFLGAKANCLVVRVVGEPGGHGLNRGRGKRLCGDGLVGAATRYASSAAVAGILPSEVAARLFLHANGGDEVRSIHGADCRIGLRNHRQKGERFTKKRLRGSVAFGTAVQSG